MWRRFWACWPAPWRDRAGDDGVGLGPSAGPRTSEEVRMAERTCPVCTKRPVWRTHQSNNWRHLCKRCDHKAWAVDQKAQRAARRASKQLRSTTTQVSRARSATRAEETAGGRCAPGRRCAQSAARRVLAASYGPPKCAGSHPACGEAPGRSASHAPAGPHSTKATAGCPFSMVSRFHVYQCHRIKASREWMAGGRAVHQRDGMIMPSPRQERWRD